jgi:hypothetical protein
MRLPLGLMPLDTTFRPSLPKDLDRRRQEDRSHHGNDYEIRPGRGRTPNAKRRKHHDDVADRVVAGTKPDRTHVASPSLWGSRNSTDVRLAAVHQSRP